MENQKRLIDANALRDKLQNITADVCQEICDGFYKLGMSKPLVYLAITETPTIDAVEVVHGHWEYGRWEQGHWVKGNERCRCSVCHRDFAFDNLNIWNGCPHCFAKMDG